MKFKISKEEDFSEYAELILKTYGVGIYLLTGEMGVGKTTLTKYFLKSLGIIEFEGSPTFSIINKYRHNSTIFHLDCYRIKNKKDAFEIGMEELFDETAYFFIEWPEKIESFLPSNVIWVYIRKEENTENRIIELTHDKQS